jgi:type IV fimbrial biogenesis protein FimT
MHETGVSLIELCVALVVAAVLASLAAPTFHVARRTAAVRAASYDLMGDLQQTRGSAILEGRPAMVCLATGGGCAASPAAGWRAFLDAPGAERLIAERALAPGLELRGSRARLAFRPGALSADAATLTICDTQGVAAPRAIVISRAGRPRFGKAAGGDCRA